MISKLNFNDYVKLNENEDIDELQLIEEDDDCDYIEFINIEDNVKDDINDDIEPDDFLDTVIQVQNVSMVFNVALTNTSGIKDYVIQKLKRKVKYRKMRALSNINFNVYKGEVVGIIGSNGSGKSTLLRIISGALKPTEGRVVVDKKKIQLLTLGTGFDMELTARENVYLNGAIIGYSKKFIDDNYDYIVNFAGLEGFMDEKVKNFSSGMMSRLGFAIATAGEASEILILDEVLSVGDEYFRNKSLKRIKEMIHGGSTVLMVSHSLSTIVEHCDRVVWIEKGKVAMIGKPDKVCEAYRKMSNGGSGNNNSTSNSNNNNNSNNNSSGNQRDNKDSKKAYSGVQAAPQAYTGLKMQNGEWVYMVNGIVAVGFTGIVTNIHGNWYVREGKIDITYTGDVKFEGKIYKIVRGKSIN